MSDDGDARKDRSRVVTRDPTRLREAMRRAPKPLEERIVRAHEDEVSPLWDERFAELMLGALAEPPTGAVLELGAGTGTLTAEILRRHSGDGRVVALEASPILLERARERCRAVEQARGALTTAPVFLRAHDPTRKLPFAEETFDLVLAGPAIATVPDAAGLLAELVRVAVPGGRIVIAQPLAGTWQEPLDLFAEVLTRMGRVDARHALERYRDAIPDADTLREILTEARLTDIEITTTRWELLFRSGREFFYAPVVESGPLPDWRVIAGEGGDMLDPFVAWKETIDTYYTRQAFPVTVVGGCSVARKAAEITLVTEEPGADAADAAKETPES